MYWYATRNVEECATQLSFSTQGCEFRHSWGPWTFPGLMWPKYCANFMVLRCARGYVYALSWIGASDYATLRECHVSCLSCNLERGHAQLSSQPSLQTTIMRFIAIRTHFVIRNMPMCLCGLSMLSACTLKFEKDRNKATWGPCMQQLLRATRALSRCVVCC
jgi:hypothetical protein